MACSCAETAKFLASLGCPHAAKMHAVGVGLSWTVDDLLVHFAEEERYLFPILRVAEFMKMIPAGTVDRLFGVHSAIREHLSRGGKTTDAWVIAVLAEHAAEEDRVISMLTRSGALSVHAKVQS